MRINNNPAALAAFRNLTTNNASVDRTMERLSSGQQINRAVDDAAGLVRSESLRTQISSTIQATQNAQDGISFLQTAEGALNEVQALLQRARTLAIDAANSATTTGEAQQREIDGLLAEVEAIGARTTFSGVAVFEDFTGMPLVFQVGVDSDAADRAEIDMDLRTDLPILAGGALVGLDVINDPDGAIAALDTAIESMSSTRAELGSMTSRLEHTVSNLLVARENLSASESRIRDADMALEIVNLTSAQILADSATAMLGQANVTPQAVLDLLNR